MVSISKTGYYYQAKRPVVDEEIVGYLSALAQTHKRWGFDKMMLKAKLDGKGWNHKRVYRIYREQKLHLRVKPRKRLPKGKAKVLIQPLAANYCWSMDFMSDGLSDGRAFRTLNVIDDYNREVLLIEPSHSLPSVRVIALLERLIAEKGCPERIRIDNGPEFRSACFQTWAAQHGIELVFIQPGKPAQNGLIERFNKTYRQEVLDMNWFGHLEEVRSLSREWMKRYNEERPHESLAGLPPILFAKQRQNGLIRGGNSTFKRS